MGDVIEADGQRMFLCVCDSKAGPRPSFEVRRAGIGGNRNSKLTSMAGYSDRERASSIVVV